MRWPASLRRYCLTFRRNSEGAVPGHPHYTRFDTNTKMGVDPQPWGISGADRMFHSNRTTATLTARVALVLCATLVTTGAMAATPKLESIAVTPAAKTILVGQKQSFTATGTFSNGSKQALGPAISNIAPGDRRTPVQC